MASLEHASPAPGAKEWSLRHWLAATCFQLAYSCINTSMATVVLPTEAARMWPEGASVWLGIMIGTSGVTQLCSPIAGKFSDNCRSSFGRRRPVMVFGTVVTCAGAALLFWSSLYMFRYAYILGIFILELGLNISYAAQCGLPADLQEGVDDDDSAGTVSMALALQGCAGTLIAMIVVFILKDFPIQSQYVIYVVAALLTTVTVLFTVSEVACDLPAQKISMEVVVNCYRLESTGEGRDFFLVCAGRMFYYLSTSIVVFLMYYMRDVLDLESRPSRQKLMAELIVIATFVGGACVGLFGKLSDNCGRKPAVYLAQTIISLSFSIFGLVLPQLGGTGHHGLLFLLTGTLFGIGNAAYLSVDYAMGLDCLPPSKTAAEAFGIWGVCGFIGSTVGPLIGGHVVTLRLPGDPVPQPRADGTIQYSHFGYCALMLGLGVMSNVISASCTMKINRSLHGSSGDPKELKEVPDQEALE